MGWEDSPGEGNGNPLQYSCLENSMDRGAWWAAVSEVSKTRLFGARTHSTMLSQVMLCLKKNKAQ